MGKKTTEHAITANNNKQSDTIEHKQSYIQSVRITFHESKAEVPQSKNESELPEVLRKELTNATSIDTITNKIESILSESNSLITAAKAIVNILEWHLKTLWDVAQCRRVSLYDQERWAAEDARAIIRRQLITLVPTCYSIFQEIEIYCGNGNYEDAIKYCAQLNLQIRAIELSQQSYADTARTESDELSLADEAELRKGELRKLIDALDKKQRAGQPIDAEKMRKELNIRSTLAKLRSNIRYLKQPQPLKDRMLALLSAKKHA